MTCTFKSFGVGLVLLIVALGGSSENMLSGTAGTDPPNITERPQPTVSWGCSNTSTAPLISLLELGQGTYLASQGGLYPDGMNEPPAEWAQAGLVAAGEILPRDSSGRPSENGKIVLLSIGMSNTTHEWSGRSPHFEGTADGFMQQAARYADCNPHLVIVDGAVSGRSANSIVPGGVYYTTYWPMVMTRLSQARVTANQVQVIWLKEVNPCPGQPICGNRNLTPARGDWPGYARELQGHLEQIVQELESRFPNLKQLFVSPRTYGGYALSTLNPEPFAFETSFAVKWLIEERIKAGKTRPWLDWGPYLWANGLTPNAQGLKWACEDFVESDRTHPSKSGVAKVGKLLLDFFTTSPYTRSWFTPSGKAPANLGTGPVFGAHVVFGSQSPPPDANLIRDLGIRTTTYWAYPGPGGAFNVSQVIQAVDEIKRQTGGLDVRVHLMPLSQAEARSLGNMFRLPANMSAYLASVEQLAQALKGKVQHYSIGNEFSGLSWAGAVEEYGQLLEQTRQAIKSVDPSAILLDSGMAGLTLAMTIPNDLYRQGKTQEAIDFLNKLLEHHVGGFRQYLPITTEAQLVAFLNRPEVAKTIQMSDARFGSYCSAYDVLQLHDYQGWETLEEVFDWVQGKMAANGCIKPIEVWELGYGWDDASTYNVDLHAKGVTKSLIIAVAKGAQAIIYFPLTDRGNYARALLTREYGVLPPAIAYKVAVQKLSGVTQAQKLDLGEGLWVYQFTKGAQETYALWSETARTVSLPISANTVKITRITGETVTADPRNLMVDESPIFVEPEAKP